MYNIQKEVINLQEVKMARIYRKLSMNSAERLTES